MVPCYSWFERESYSLNYYNLKVWNLFYFIFFINILLYYIILYYRSVQVPYSPFGKKIQVYFPDTPWYRVIAGSKENLVLSITVI